jgi:hypothetical protein
VDRRARSFAPGGVLTAACEDVGPHTLIREAGAGSLDDVEGDFTFGVADLDFEVD